MAEPNEKSRIEAFSDGVFAIAITLLILELKIPEARTVPDLWKGIIHLWPSYFAFLFSFGAILVMWVNHHAMFNMIDKVSRSFMYANGFLLLTIVFFPYPTALLAAYRLHFGRSPSLPTVAHIHEARVSTLAPIQQGLARAEWSSSGGGGRKRRADACSGRRAGRARTAAPDRAPREAPIRRARPRAAAPAGRWRRR